MGNLQCSHVLTLAGHKPEIGHDCFQFLLDFADQILDGGGGPGPEDKAMSGVLIAGIFEGVFEFHEDLVDGDLFEVWVEEFLFLLGVAVDAVGVVALLDQFLQGILSDGTNQDSKGSKPRRCGNR